jgi:hypothetical protein
MTIRFAQATGHAMLDAIETDIGTSPILYFRSGAPPTNLTDADTGTLLATINLPADWAAAAASWAKSKSGTWQDLSADAGGTLGHWRLKTSGGVVKLDGTITATGGGGDIEVDNTNVAAGQQIDVTSFAINFPTANRGS